MDDREQAKYQLKLLLLCDIMNTLTVGDDGGYPVKPQEALSILAAASRLVHSRATICPCKDCTHTVLAEAERLAGDVEMVEGD